MLFSSKVAILSSSGSRIRHVPGPLAAALVSAGSASVGPVGGRVREVTLTRTAATSAQRVGEARGTPFGTPFTRYRYLEQSGARVIEHHPRCCWGIEDE